MSKNDTIKLIFLSAIWGGSFIFMRILSPAIGPIVTADLRVLIAGFALLLYYRAQGIRMALGKDFKHFAFIGIMNAGVPFTLFSYAALYVPAGYSAIINSTSPVFSALISGLWLGLPLSMRHILGFISGILGVACVTHIGDGTLSSAGLMAVGACVVASATYGLTGAYIKKFGGKITSPELAAKSQIYAGVSLLPLAIYFWPQSTAFTPKVLTALMGLAFLSSALAYVLYFPLLKRYGATKALTVTYLVPIFGILWSYLFLGEPLEFRLLFGAIFIFAGTALVLSARGEEV